MKRLSPVVRKIIAVYLGLLLLALLFVPVYQNEAGSPLYMFLPLTIWSSYYMNYEALRLEILVLTVAAAFALAISSLLSSRHDDTH